MPKFIALLRGINVGGHKKITMADLRTHLETIGLKNVVTYIQSGNVVFESDAQNDNAFAKAIQTKINKEYGFDVPTLVISVGHLQRILKNYPFPQELKEQSVFTILKTAPTIEDVNHLNAQKYLDVTFKASDDCVYIHSAKSYARIKLNNNLIEQKLKVTATSRNFRTVTKLIELAQS